MRKLLVCSTTIALADTGGPGRGGDRVDQPNPAGKHHSATAAPWLAHRTNEISEILMARVTATPNQLAQAKQDNDIEDATIFAGVIGSGWDLNKLPKTKFLMDRIMVVDRPDSSTAKHYFHRSRPWIVDPTVQTCADHEQGPAANSYPSGHTMLGYELGVVLASLMPHHAQAILARAQQYGENRIVCGFHFRSDVTAGEQFGTVLAVEMMQHPVFHGWFKEAQAELKAAGLVQ